MGLVSHTVGFFVINILVVVLVSMSGSLDVNQVDAPSTLNTSDLSDTDINYGEVSSITDYTPSSSSMTNAGIPSWLVWFFILVDSIWGSFIVIGWIRGQN